MIIRFDSVLSNTAFPSRMNIIDNDGEAKVIRLIEGSTKVLESEQPKDAVLRGFKTGYANIVEGDKMYYQTEITDKAIINYLQALPWWGKYIKEYNPITESLEKSQNFKSQAGILFKLAHMKEEDILALGYARYGRKAFVFAQSKDYEGLRVKIAEDAQQNYEDIASLIEDEKNQDKLMTGLAFIKEILIETDAGNSVSWGHNSSKILSVPRDVAPVDAIVQFYGESEEGRELRKEVYNKITTKATKTSASKAQSKTNETEK